LIIGHIVSTVSQIVAFLLDEKRKRKSTYDVFSVPSKYESRLGQMKSSLNNTFTSNASEGIAVAFGVKIPGVLPFPLRQGAHIHTSSPIALWFLSDVHHA
jgi:hypothetical protein